MKRRATRKALELDDSLSEAHAARAVALTGARRWNEAESEFRRAIELNPNAASARYFYAFRLLGPENRLDQALEQFRTALSLDPLSPVINTNYAVMLMMARRYPEAVNVNVVWHVVNRYCHCIGPEHVAPHDLRRTCAKLCHTSGGELETDSVPARPCLGADHRAVSGLQSRI